MAVYLIIAIFLSVIKVCDASDICYYGYYYYYNRFSSYTYQAFTMYCDSGCCGYFYTRNCCTSTGTIVGGVVGAFISVFVIVFVVSCICKKTHVQGRLIHPRPQQTQAGGINIVNTTQMQQMMSAHQQPIQHMHFYSQMPGQQPVYGQTINGQPMYPPQPQPQPQPQPGPAYGQPPVPPPYASNDVPPPYDAATPAFPPPPSNAATPAYPPPSTKM